MLTRSRLAICGVLVLVFAQTAAPQPAPAFPLKPSNDKRFLTDQASVPFPIVGRALWELVSLSPSDRSTILSDTVGRGYTAVEMRAPSRIAAAPNAPFNGNGNLPFLKRLDGAPYTGALSYGNINNEAPDFTTPNEAYWSYLDGIFADCLARGLVVLYFPAYNGYGGGSEGWMQEMSANGTARMQAYGAWVATRYRNQPNLVWLIAGDYGSSTFPYQGSQQSVEQAFVTGLQSVSGPSSNLISAEASDPSISSDLPGTVGTAISLNGAYSFGGDVNTQGRRAYSHSPTIPSYLIEEPYDEEGPDGTGKNSNATQPVRRFQWWGWLSTIGGFVSGNGYIIHFSVNWQNHLGSPNTQDMTRLQAFMRSIPWYSLIPSGLGGARTLITAGGSGAGSSDYVSAAVTANGSLLVAYVPPAHSGPITVDMGALASPAQARWFDPTNAASVVVGSMLPNSGGRVFTTPGNNSAGAKDWVLVLDTSAVRAPAAPNQLRIVP